MDNNVNLVGSKKKKTRSKRKKPFTRLPQQMPVTNAAATLQGLKTIANLIQIHQRLSLTAKPRYESVTQPKPLMSGPRYTRPMFSGLNMPGFRKPGPHPQSTRPEQNNPTSGKTQTQPSIQNPQDVNKNATTSTCTSASVKTCDTKVENLKNPETITSQSKNSPNPNVESVKSQPVKDTASPKSSTLQSNQFEDFEIFNSPSFINFETKDEVDLNDDGLNLNEADNKDKSIQNNINTKLQQQMPKKLEIKDQSQEKNSPVNEGPSQPKPTAQDDSNKATNKELVEGSSPNIKTVAKDNIKSSMKWQNKDYHMQERVFDRSPAADVRLPAGIPRSFLVQNRAGTPHQQPLSKAARMAQWTNPHISKWDLPLFLQTQDTGTSQAQPYSPTDIYQDNQSNDATHEGSESPDLLEPGSKRVSAFQRLGPLSQPKKPKLTINLNLNKEEAVREVVDETYLNVPVHDREDINNSTDETVVKYLPYWPWKKSVAVRKSVTARNSKTVMMLEKEQMEEIYDRDSSLIMLSVTGYPPTWTKENLLDVLLENLKGKSFIPCFIEFTTKECKFFVIRCRNALLSIHWFGFVIKKDDIELTITISQTLLTVKQIDFIPRLVLRKRLATKYDGFRLDLSEFTLKKDVSHFIYFPLNRDYNQSELIQLQCDVRWERLTELDLSHNRITSIKSFKLETTTPHLKVLNISHNYIDSILTFLPCRNLPLKRLMLDGNPLCLDYIDPDHYIKVARSIFSGLRELDGVPITLKGDLPVIKKNYCPEDAKPIVEKFLGVFFPLLDSDVDDRQAVQEMYSKKAVMTITCKNKLRYDPSYKHIRNFAIKSQNLLEGNEDSVKGAASIGKLVKKWPRTRHDPATFTADVLYHDDTSTIFNVTGILKLTAETLAEDEPLLAFSRTIVLSTKNGCKYKIQNELLHWKEPTREYSMIAFKTVMIPKKTLSLKFDSTPDDETKNRLLNIFMQLTELDEKASERCLELRNWHFQRALEHFVKLFKLDEIHTLNT